MKHIKQFFFIFGLFVPLSILNAHSDINQKNWKDLMREMSSQKNENSVDCNELLDKYIEEIKHLFDVPSLSIKQRNIVHKMCGDCFTTFINFVDKKEYNSIEEVLIDLHKENAQCFALWAGSIARITTIEYLRTKYQISDDNLAQCANADGYKIGLKRAHTRKKGSLSYLVNGIFDDAIKKEIEHEMESKKSVLKK